MASEMSDDVRRERARLGAYSLHAQGKTNTAPARAALWARYEQQVDPLGELTPDERRRRAEHARRAHMARLSLAAAKARSERARERQRAEAEVAARIAAAHAAGVPVRYRGAAER